MGEPSWVEVARALAAAPWWEWRAGMLALAERSDGSRVAIRVALWDRGAVAGVGVRLMPSGRVEQAPVYSDDIPDLTDAATAGALLGMLPPGWWAAQLVSSAHTVVCDGGPARGATLGEAVGLALLAVRGGR